MSADGSVTLNWAGEERKFRLAIGQLRELQESVNRWRTTIGAPLIGPNSLMRLLAAGDAWPSDVREIIRLGLIGGKDTKINLIPGLMTRYVDERPLMESTQVAQAVLLVALVGVPEDPVGKKPQAETEAETTTASSSPPSTEPDAPSDLAHEKSTTAPSGSLPPASMDSSKPTAQKPSPTP